MGFLSLIGLLVDAADKVIGLLFKTNPGTGAMASDHHSFIIEAVDTLTDRLLNLFKITTG